MVIGAAMGIALLGTLLDGRGAALLRTARRFDGNSVLRVFVHAAAFTLLVALTAHIFDSSGPPPGAFAAWSTAWALAVLTTGVSALWCATPSGQFRPLLHAGLKLVPWGLLIGVGGWIAGQSSLRLWIPLSHWTLRATSALISLILNDVTISPEEVLIASPRFEVVIAPVCSGFEGLGLMTVFVAAYLGIARSQLRFPAALWLLPLGLVAAWCANVLRIALLFVVGAVFSPTIAANGFHAKAGWLFFCLVALGLVLLSQRSRWFTRDVIRNDYPRLLEQPTAAYLLPFMGVLAAALLSGLAIDQVDWLYGLRFLAGVPLLYAYRHHYRGLLRDNARSWLWFAVLGGIVAGALFYLLTPRPEPALVADWEHEWRTAAPGLRALWIGVRVLGSVTLIPLVEELAFRGYLLRRVSAPAFEQVTPGRGSWRGLVLSSLAFGAIHDGWVAGALAGLLYGMVLLRHGLGPAIVAHATSNLILALAAVLGQRWLWL